MVKVAASASQAVSESFRMLHLVIRVLDPQSGIGIAGKRMRGIYIYIYEGPCMHACMHAVLSKQVATSKNDNKPSIAYPELEFYRAFPHHLSL